MKWMENFKAFIGSKVLDKHLKSLNREPLICNINDARHIGIIYNATDFVSFEIIRNLVKDLSHSTRKVSVLGYVDSKKLIDNYLYRKGFDFFSKNELNWYYRPVSPIVDDFIKEPFDLLINLSLEDYFPIRYITALSPARFKTGKYSVDDDYLDLMIDIEKEKQAMLNLEKEINKEGDYKRHDDETEIEADVKKKTETEIQLNFLINQLLHYLSILRK